MKHIIDGCIEKPTKRQAYIQKTFSYRKVSNEYHSEFEVISENKKHALLY